MNHPRGGLDNPLSREDLIDKFNTLSGAYLDEIDQLAVCALIMDLEEVKNIRLALGKL